MLSTLFSIVEELRRSEMHPGSEINLQAFDFLGEFCKYRNLGLEEY